MKRDAFILALIAALASPAAAQEVVHGENSIFASAGVRLAWAVKRGQSEAETLVIVRALADSGYRAVRVDGVNPFIKASTMFVAARPLDRVTDLSIPRAQFADFPSSQFHFFASTEDAAANKPKLTVFYLGIPDTAPEFVNQHEVEAYLDRMQPGHK